ncbi:caspase, EACC1-associated type [Actinoalloteichus hymeniacidonis]|uniref:caspase, EACC1-associated type n=1 Tax=Actinoalloteichus hymeniacidonis TaxID=340345 RepID=UPI0017E5C99C|nr:AAA domain-containing protein [Actinoalloteichus hymeniacidonis]MBB5908255.1 hypothetical protein [Actinoalloteichus hymeniacidonis]
MTRRRALLIHTENYQDPRFPALPSTRADTWQLKQVLDHRNIGGFESVKVVGDLTANDLRIEISEFLESCEQDELALLYFSGHGERAIQTTGEFYFVATDTDLDRLAETGLGAGFVNEQLEQCWAAHKIAMLDCCLSGGFVMGLRTSDPSRGIAKSAPQATQAPLNSHGVYVLSSSGPLEESFSGAGTADEPAPSVFTGAVVEALRTGQASKDGSGTVSVEDLGDHVTRKLRGRKGQIPTRSAFGVNDRVVIASCPVGKAPELASLRHAPPAERPRDRTRTDTSKDADVPKRPVTWQNLVDYYRGCVLEESAAMPYLPVSENGQSYVCLPGEEQIISGHLDEHGTAEVPPEAQDFVASTNETDELWAGYPAVVLNKPRTGKAWPAPRFAPLLIRRVEIVGGEDGAPPRFRPFGPVIPHPGLATDHLGEEAAAHLGETYQPTWHAGQHGLLARDARNLVMQDFELPCVQELHPDFLESRIDTNSPGHGARNAAVLIRHAPSGGASTQLLKDLEYIAQHHAKIPDTALGALLPGSRNGIPAEPVLPVTPLPANEAQVDVLQAAMTQPITVATGPPGTGKSQLVANTIATAMSHKQSVLIASTNNQAVDEVWQRCNRLLPDSVVRTGSSSPINYRQYETDALQRLLKSTPSNINVATATAEHKRTHREHSGVRQELARKAKMESSLRTAAKDRERYSEILGCSTNALTERLGSRLSKWERRARQLEQARFLGEWRRTRLLRRFGIDANTDTRASCQSLASFAASQIAWLRLRADADTAPTDDVLTGAVSATDAAIQDTSLATWKAALITAVNTGKPAIQALLQASTGNSSDWAARRRAVPHVRAWATTSLSARRFPTDPALFDLVIIDEASQCSIPQIIPLLFRARRALIIGDVMQLAHITSLTSQRESTIRRRAGISSAFLEQHRLAFRRHSAFHAAESSHRGSLLLDEHYRCHPDIAAISNELFYGGALAVLTDIRGRPVVNRPAVTWAQASGKSERPQNGGSWINREEVLIVRKCVDYLLEHLPQDATIGVVTPFKAQQTELMRVLRAEERVRVGTVHTFQGGERDAMVLSLVAGPGMKPGAVSWVNQQLNLWNVAITRARSHLIVVGDREFWSGYGGTGSELVLAAERASDAGSSLAHASDDLGQRLYEVATAIPGVGIELSCSMNGYAVDAVLTHEDGIARPVLIDRGNTGAADPARHLRRQLRRCELLTPIGSESSAIRMPSWKLHDPDAVRIALAKTSTASSADEEGAIPLP